MENLADCIRMWMIDYKKNSVKPSTYDRLIVSRKLLERSHTSPHEVMLSAGAVPAVAKSHGNHAFN